MGFFDIFRKSVKKTKQSLSLELDSFSGKITFDTLEELEEILILADVGEMCRRDRSWRRAGSSLIALRTPT